MSSVRNKYRKLLGEAYKETAMGSRCVERTGIKCLPPFNMEMLSEIARV